MKACDSRNLCQEVAMCQCYGGLTGEIYNACFVHSTNENSKKQLLSFL